MHANRRTFKCAQNTPVRAAPAACNLLNNVLSCPMQQTGMPRVNFRLQIFTQGYKPETKSLVILLT